MKKNLMKMKKELPSLLWGEQMSHKRIPKQTGGRRTLEDISKRIYYVKRGFTTGIFTVGIAALGFKVMLELITPPPEDESAGRNLRFTIEEALKKEYNVTHHGGSSKIQVPLVLLGARVKIHFVN